VPRLSFRHLPALLLTAALLSGCSFFEQPPHLRGNAVDPDSLKDLVIGTSTRADVNSLLGSPTAKAVFDDNTWLYISEVTQPRIGRIQGINSQNVVVMNFDQNGVLRGIKRLDQDDGKPVAVVSRATPSPGSDATFMQQLLGNVGKFTPGAGSAATTNNAGSSGNSIGRGNGI
jgi:outer membrane protein assembly factor BamE (lipoprotein component of BamABCDE complex)